MSARQVLYLLGYTESNSCSDLLDIDRDPSDCNNNDITINQKFEESNFIEMTLNQLRGLGALEILISTSQSRFLLNRWILLETCSSYPSYFANKIQQLYIRSMTASIEYPPVFPIRSNSARTRYRLPITHILHDSALFCGLDQNGGDVGWFIHDIEEHAWEMGILEHHSNGTIPLAISNFNESYTLSPTYPPLLILPTQLTLKHVSNDYTQRTNQISSLLFLMFLY